MRHQLLIILGILVCPSFLHAQTPTSPSVGMTARNYVAPFQPGGGGPVTRPTEENEDRWYARPLAIEGHVGLGTPVGLAGAALDYSPSRWFGGGIGVGAGTAGPQAAAMARFRMPLTEGLGLGLGGGLSGGNYEWVEGGVFSVFIDNPSTKMWKPAYWANADLSIEGRLQGGFTIRGYVGRASILNPNDATCGTGSASELNHCQTAHQKDGLALGYVGLAMGYAFAR